MKKKWFQWRDNKGSPRSFSFPRTATRLARAPRRYIDRNYVKNREGNAEEGPDRVEGDEDVVCDWISLSARINDGDRVDGNRRIRPGASLGAVPKDERPLVI